MSIDDKAYEAEIAKAHKRVHDLDKVDGYRDRSPGAIIAAVTAGLKEPTTQAIFDALVMLEDLRCEVPNPRLFFFPL